jgi:DNA-binding CsgD family transcriptional regulator
MSSLTNTSMGTGQTRKLGRLLENIYMTAADPDAWMPLLRDLVGATASRSARLLVMNAEADRVFSSRKLNIDDAYHRRYTDYFVNKCPWRPELRRMAPGRLYSTYLHFSCRQPDFYRTEFFNDWARYQNIHHGICGTVYRGCGQTVQLLIQRTRGQGHYTEEETAFVNQLVPHMQHAFLISAKMARIRSRSEAAALAAERERLPFFLLDRNRKVIHCSPDAERLVLAKGMLEIRKGRLEIADQLQNSRLNRLTRECLAAAVSREIKNAGGHILVPRPQGGGMRLLIRPMLPEIPLLVGEPDVYVAVYVSDPGAGIVIDADRLKTLYQLSDAEARVAAAMVATVDSAEMARSCAIGMNTLRTHLKAIFAKTQTQNRADLMKLLLTGPARTR